MYRYVKHVPTVCRNTRTDYLNCFELLLFARVFSASICLWYIAISYTGRCQLLQTSLSSVTNSSSERERSPTPEKVAIWGLKKGRCRVLEMCEQSANRIFRRRNASFALCSSFSKGVFGTAAIRSNWQQKYCSQCWDNEWTISDLLERSQGGKKTEKSPDFGDTSEAHTYISAQRRACPPCKPAAPQESACSLLAVKRAFYCRIPGQNKQTASVLHRCSFSTVRWWEAFGRTVCP